MELTRTLVAFNTINPPGNERPCAELLGSLLETAGFSISYHEFADTRTSLVARIGGSSDTKPLCYTGHLDVVPLGGAPWTVDPFAGEIAEAARGAGFEVEVEDHQLWASDLERSLNILRLIGMVALILLLTIVISVIAFATHAALLARRDVVSVLHTCGASDRFISRLFEYRFFGLGLRAGGIGALFALLGAMLLFFGAKQAGDRSWLLPQMSPDIGTFLVLLITPVIAATVSMIAARITVSRALGELS